MEALISETDTHLSREAGLGRRDWHETIVRFGHPRFGNDC
jgi:hypothetical protein